MGAEIDRVHLIPWYSQNCAQGEAFTVDGDFKLKTKARHSFSIKACQGLKGAHFELLFVAAFKIFDEHDNLMSLFTISAARRRRARLKNENTVFSTIKSVDYTVCKSTGFWLYGVHWKITASGCVIWARNNSCACSCTNLLLLMPSKDHWKDLRLFCQFKVGRT